jgi:hypothetical protein
MRRRFGAAAVMVSMLCTATVAVPAAAGAKAPAETCNPTSLRITAAVDDAANWPTEALGPYRYLRLDIVNAGSAACALPGDVRIQLFGPNDKQQGPSWKLPPPAASASLNLAAGGRARTAIRYFDDDIGPWGLWKPAWAVATFPGAAGWVFVPWPAEGISHDYPREPRKTAILPLRPVG